MIKNIMLLNSIWFYQKISHSIASYWIVYYTNWTQSITPTLSIYKNYEPLSAFLTFVYHFQHKLYTKQLFQLFRYNIRHFTAKIGVFKTEQNFVLSVRRFLTLCRMFIRLKNKRLWAPLSASERIRC